MTSRYVHERELDDLIDNLDGALALLCVRREYNRDAYNALGDRGIHSSLSAAANYLHELRMRGKSA